MGLFSWREQSKHVRSLRKDFKRDVERYQEEVPLADNLEKEFQKLEKLANYLFDAGFNVQYRFTYDDLKLELENKALPGSLGNDSESICSSLSEMEFDMTKITRQKLIDTSNLLLNLAVEIETMNEKEPKQGLFSIFTRKEKMPEVNTSESFAQKSITDIPIPEFIFHPSELAVPKQVMDEPVKLLEYKHDAPLKHAHAKSKAEVKKAKPIEVKEEKIQRQKKAHEKIKVQKVHVTKKKGSLKLPSFEVMEIKHKEEGMKKDLTDIVKGLATGKQEIKDEIKLLGKEKTILEKQKEQLKEFDLPAFKVFNTSLTGQIDTIDSKTKGLEAKEKEMGERLKAATALEYELNQKSLKLQKDDESIKERTSYLEAKDKVIRKIKDEMNSKYRKAISEIENLKLELAVKEKNFLELQKFYQQRENRLSVEEGNLLDEKRRYGRHVSGLLLKHIEVAKHDLDKTAQKHAELKEKLRNADAALKDSEKKFRSLSHEREEIEKEMREKLDYFAEIEKGFIDKDPKFEETSKLLDIKMNNNLERESAVKTFEKDLDASTHQFRSRSDYLDIKELDIKALEKEIERVQLNIRSRETRVKLLDKHVKRRVDTYDQIKRQTSSGVTNEKRLISLIVARLTKKGYMISGKINDLEKDEKVYDMYNRKLKEAGLDAGPMQLDDFGMETDAGNPSILDILRLLNISRDYLEHGERERARDAYLEIQRIFEDLNEDEREDIYPEVTKVFKSKNIMHNENRALRNEPDYNGVNIDELLSRFESCVNTSDYEMSEQVYLKLQERYTQLSSEDKNRYYPRIMEVYNKVLEHHVSTGTV